MKRLILLYATAATLVCAQDRPALPSLAERGWFKAEPLFAPPAPPAERSWLSGPAFAVDSPTAPVAAGRAWQLNPRLRLSLETATYTPPRHRMVSGLPNRDTTAAIRFEFRF